MFFSQHAEQTRPQQASFAGHSASAQPATTWVEAAPTFSAQPMGDRTNLEPLHSTDVPMTDADEVGGLFDPNSSMPGNGWTFGGLEPLTLPLDQKNGLSDGAKQEGRRQPPSPWETTPSGPRMSPVVMSPLGLLPNLRSPGPLGTPVEATGHTNRQADAQRFFTSSVTASGPANPNPSGPPRSRPRPGGANKPSGKVKTIGRL